MPKYSGNITLTSVSDGAGAGKTYIKYARDDHGTDMNDSPSADRIYIGICSNSSAESAPDDYTQYVWSKYLGNGISATIIEYAAGTSGTQHPDTGWSTTIPTVPPEQFLWTRITTQYTESDPTYNYSVSKIGKDGTDGQDGKDGKDGKDGAPGQPGQDGVNGYNQATIFLYKRAAATPAQQAPTAGQTYTFASQTLSGDLQGWLRTIPEYDASGNPVWITLATAASQGSTDIIDGWSVPQIMAENGADGKDGEDGEPGAHGYNTAILTLYSRTKTTVDWTATLTYTFSTNTLSSIPSGWDRSMPSGTGKLYMTSATAYGNTDTDTIAYTDWSAPVQYEGQDGQDGTDGQDGISYYTHIKYGDSKTPNPMYDVPDGHKFIGIYTGTSQSAPDTYTSYTWSEYVGADGAKGDKGDSGEDGAPGYNTATIYLYKRATSAVAPSATYTYTFANQSLNPDPSAEGWSRTIPAQDTNKYPVWVTIATAVGQTATDNIDGWSTPQILAEDGADGQDGAPGRDGTDGQDGTSSYTWIRYSANSDGTGFIDHPTSTTKYIGVYSGTSATAPTSKTDYNWSKYVGDNGNGINSITYYYLTNNSSLTPRPEQITDTTMTVPTASNRYLWQKEVIDFTDTSVADQVTVILLTVYGETGQPGQAGTSVTIDSKAINYASSTQGTNPESVTGWSTTIPSVALGSYLWTRTTVNYSDGNSTVSYSVAYKGTNGTNGTNGYNTALVYLYKRSSTVITTIPWTTTLTYNFSQKKITSTLPTGWTETLPSGMDPAYMTVATAYSQDNTDDISSNEWAAPVLFVQNGAKGDPGTDAPPVKVQYSQTGESGTWHPDFTTGDKYAHYSYDGTENYGPAIRIVGEDGQDANSYSIEARLSNGDLNAIFKSYQKNIDSTELNSELQFSVDQFYLYFKNSLAGQNYAKITVYKTVPATTTDIPGRPTVSYTFATQSIVVTGSTGWSMDFPNTIGTDDKIYACTGTLTTTAASGNLSMGVVEQTAVQISNISIESVDSAAENFDLNIAWADSTSNNSLSLKHICEGIQLTPTGTSTAINAWDCFIQHDSTNKRYIVKFEDLATCDISGKYTSVPYGLEQLAKALREQSGVIVVKWISQNKTIATDTIDFSFSSTDDFAKFALNAYDISMAINEANLKFSEQGLTITNGGFTIQHTESGQTNPVQDLYWDNGLHIIGDITANSGTFTGEVHATSGEFSGIVNATDGSFNGTITANAGSIGGFNIGDGILTSTDEANSIVLNGATGKIIANNIELGIGAVINEYIQLGNAYLRNPGIDNIVFEAGNFKILQNGALQLGNLNLDGSGANATISDDAGSWSIQNGSARFANVDVSGVIRTAVFEKDTTQAAGGRMIFKTSMKVIGNTATTSGHVDLIVEGDQHESFKANDWLAISVNGNLTSVTIASVTYTAPNTTIRINTTTAYSANQIDSIIQLLSSSYTTDIIFGINGGNGTLNIDDITALYPRGLTLQEIYKANSSLVSKSTPNLFLGDLSSLSSLTVGLSGYGLYAENAYLKGSLTTQLMPQAKFAGINTLASATFNKDEDSANPDHSRIVFWGGANSANNEDIQDAPFQVSENGTIYAAQGRFTGSVISKSMIEASILRGAVVYAADIYGWDGASAETGTPSATAALRIHDADKGIEFWSGNNVLYSLGNNGFLKNGSAFIDFSEANPTFNGGTVYSSSDDSLKQISLEGTTIYLSSKASGGESFQTDWQILNDNDNMAFLIKDGSNHNYIRYSGLIAETIQNAQFDDMVYFGNEQSLRYQKHVISNVTDGYDLYVQ